MKHPRFKLLGLLLTIAVLPSLLLTVFSIHKFRNVLENEKTNRLLSTSKEIETILSDFIAPVLKNSLMSAENPKVLADLKSSSIESLRLLLTDWLRKDVSTQASFFDGQGQLLITATRDKNGYPITKKFDPEDQIFLSKSSRGKIEKTQSEFLESDSRNTLSKVILTKFQKNEVLGWSEQILTLTSVYLENLKSRLMCDIFFLDQQSQVIIASHPDFFLYQKNVFEKDLNPQGLMNSNFKGQPYRFLVTPIKWGNDNIRIGLAISMVETNKLIRDTTLEFLSVFAAISVLSLVLILLILRLSSRSFFQNNPSHH